MGDLLFVRTPLGVELAKKTPRGLVPVTLEEKPMTDKPIKVPELEMHRAVYEMFKEAGWESPEECLSAYGNLEARLASQERALGVANTLLKEVYTYTDDLPEHLAIKVDGYVKPLLKGCGE